MIEIIRQPITQEKLRSFLGQPFPEMVKFAVDIDREIIALGGEMHADAEDVLLRDGSIQSSVWGANVYPLRSEEDCWEYESLINIRPAQKNRSIEIQDAGVRERVREIAKRLLFE